MSGNEFMLQVFIKSSKTFRSDGWQPVSVSVIEQGRVVKINFDLAKSSAPSSAVVGSRQNITENSGHPLSLKEIVLPLAEFRQPKLKQLKNKAGLASELRSRMSLVSTRIYQFFSEDQVILEKFHLALQKAYLNTSARRPSVSNLVVVDPPLNITGPLAIKTVPAAPAAQSTVPEAYDVSSDECGFGGGEYATLSNGDVIFEGDNELPYFESKIFESFDAGSYSTEWLYELTYSVLRKHLNSTLTKYLNFKTPVVSFNVTVDEDSDNQGDSLWSLLRVSKGDEMLLYLGRNQLELLTRKNPRLICEWPFTQIKGIAYSPQMVRIEFGARTATGKACLIFRFGDEASPLGDDAAPPTGSFVTRLKAALSTPAPCCQSCHCGRGRGGQGDHRQRRDTDGTEDGLDDDDESSEATTPAALATTTVTPSFVHDGLYAVVQQQPHHHQEATQSATSSTGAAPEVPPHPLALEKVAPPGSYKKRPAAPPPPPPQQPTQSKTMPRTRPIIMPKPLLEHRRQSSPVPAQLENSSSVPIYEEIQTAGVSDNHSSINPQAEDLHLV